MLKRQNRRVYMVAFMDDHSRFITGYGIHASQSAALVLEVVRAAIVAYGTPQEMLTDNGSQYVTWRGSSAFHREMDKRGIQHIVAKPQRPQTLGKIERFWGTLWRECIETSVFFDLDDARRRVGHFIDYYNFQRVHRGIDGLVPADRFFGAASEVLATLRARVAANALELARNGLPKAPFYVTGRIGERAFSGPAARVPRRRRTDAGLDSTIRRAYFAASSALSNRPRWQSRPKGDSVLMYPIAPHSRLCISNRRRALPWSARRPKSRPSTALASPGSHPSIS